MKMNLDLLRNILIAIEDKNFDRDIFPSDIALQLNTDENEILYHLHLLNDAVFLKASKYQL